jgi:hypothetical protein
MEDDHGYTHSYAARSGEALKHANINIFCANHCGRTKMTEAEKKELAEKFIAGLIHHDDKLLNSILTDDVVWGLPGESPMSGEAHGVAAILKRAETRGGYGVKIEIENVVYRYQDVALHLHNTGKRGDVVLDEHLTTLCRLRGNKIYRLETLISDVPMLNAFFVRENSGATRL